MGLALYGFIRLLLWSAGVGIALFPTLQTTRLIPSWHLLGTMESVNAAGHFRDLFFVIVPASAVSLSTTLDFLCVRLRGEINALLAVIALILNIIILLSGFVGFLLIPPGTGYLSADVFSISSWLILVGLIISLVTELWISVSAERHLNLGRH